MIQHDFKHNSMRQYSAAGFEVTGKTSGLEDALTELHGSYQSPRWVFSMKRWEPVKWLLRGYDSVTGTASVVAHPVWKEGTAVPVDSYPCVDIPDRTEGRPAAKKPTDRITQPCLKHTKTC